MRTTVSISDELLEAAKLHARERGETLGVVIEDALRLRLGGAPEHTPRPPVPVFEEGTGPRAGIDLTSNRALHEVLDEGVALDERR